MKIIISKKRLPEGIRWSIKNLDDYKEYLREQNIDIMIFPSIITSSNDENDLKAIHGNDLGDIEKRIINFYCIKPGLVEYEIIEE